MAQRKLIKIKRQHVLDEYMPAFSMSSDFLKYTFLASFMQIY